MTVIRKGDIIRIINSNVVKRVGYPIVWTDLIDEVKMDERVYESYRFVMSSDLKLHLGAKIADREEIDETYANDKHYRAFVRVVAQRRVEEMRFGGNARSIHFYPTVPNSKSLGLGNIDTSKEMIDLTGRELEVIGKKNVKTGYRFPPRACGYGEDYDYEPGGLEDEKTHILLQTEYGWFCKDDVELVKRSLMAEIRTELRLAMGRIHEVVTPEKLARKLTDYKHEDVLEVITLMASRGELELDKGFNILPRKGIPGPSLSVLRNIFKEIPDHSGKV